MDLHSSSTARVPPTLRSSDAQENQEPTRVEIAAKSLVPVSGVAATAQTSSGSAPKQRKALHSIDSNRPRPALYSAVNPPKRSLSNDSLGGVKDPVEAHKQRTSLESSAEAIKTSETQIAGLKRSTTTADNEIKTPTDSIEPAQHQEGENLAWMDMMLALLEKRYGSSSTLPVCLTDLETANMLHPPQQKKLKTGVVASAQSRTSLDTSENTQTNTSKSVDRSATTLPRIPARVEGEQEKEHKRQRLLKRHAQQIQASSVSSSTSCGCKTGCLKMYCMCFSSRGFCHAGCACDDCRNGRKNQTERVEAIQNYLANDPRAFSFASPPQDTSTTGFLHLLPQKSSAVVMRGCRCKKSKCLKKYCDCFQNGIACTSHCRCMDCSNHSESTAAHEHPHLQKSSATASGKRAHSGALISPAAGSKPFHAVQITVTKQPRRNHVGKTLRLNL
ncbi:hypothetical protein PRIC2_004060 [Phytophthora ramorum]